MASVPLILPLEHLGNQLSSPLSRDEPLFLSKLALAYP